ncbi:MAG: YkgJ family cysteine cluster protein [Promethearchaeota archaeon]|nr:MAG: YkgJ family cysteine cluster protein [Candidatus Lokiarchaeota archaeon]
MSLKYYCRMCGTCCHEVPGDYVKRIPIYPDEADRLIEIAKEHNIKFQIIEDLVFPDIKNEKILIITYRIRLDNKNQGCPFYNKQSGCTVHDSKPLACQAYPLALKRIDAFNFEISIDPLCNFVISNYDELKDLDIERLKEVFKDEYPKAERFYQKNKKLIFKIRKLEALKKIEIPRQISLEEFNVYLQQWEREDLSI